MIKGEILKEAAFVLGFISGTFEEFCEFEHSSLRSSHVYKVSVKTVHNGNGKVY